MSHQRLVTVVGATGAQGGAVVRSLVETGKYKVRGLTRDSTSEKAQALKRLSDNIEMVTCDISKSDDIKRALKDSWAVFVVTDYWTQPDKPEVEMQQGTLMADVAASLQIPYYIFSVLADTNKLSGGKIDVPFFTQKAKIRDYINEKHPTLKAIFVESGFYMQNWQGFFKAQKLDDGTIVFAVPVDQKATLQMVDIDDMGPIVREILNDPEKFVGQNICICGESIQFQDLSKIFTKVTGIPSVSKSLTEEEFRSGMKEAPKFIQDQVFAMYKWIEEYGAFGKEKDWRSGQKLTKLNTFEDWLKKTGWKGD